MVEESDRVVGHLFDGGCGGAGRTTNPSVIEGDEPMSLGHGRELCRPEALVESEAHDPENGWALRISVLFVVDRHVVELGKRHRVIVRCAALTSLLVLSD